MRGVLRLGSCNTAAGLLGMRPHSTAAGRITRNASRAFHAACHEPEARSRQARGPDAPERAKLGPGVRWSERCWPGPGCTQLLAVFPFPLGLGTMAPRRGGGHGRLAAAPEGAVNHRGFPRTARSRPRRRRPLGAAPGGLTPLRH